MSDSLANQDAALIAALTGAVSKGWHREVERPHGQPAGEVIEGPAVDPLQGHGQLWVSGKPSGDDLAGQLSAALGLAPSMRLRRV